MKHKFGNLLLQVMLAMMCMFCHADGVDVLPLPEEEVSAIKAFFRGFAEALNSKDVERVKRMSGGAWGHFSERIDCQEKILDMEVLDVITDKQTNVVTKTTVGSDKGRPRSAEVIFTMKKGDGGYSIEKMAVSEVNKRNQILDDARCVLGRLAAAINGRNLDEAKNLVSFDNAADFEAELSSRGLSWIKEAIDNCVKAPMFNMSASRDGQDTITGRIYVPCALDGSNILRMVVFKDGKIDCAAPREETKDELDRRNKAKSEERRRQGEVEARNRGLLRQNSSR